MTTVMTQIKTVHPEFSTKGKPGPETPRISAMVEVLEGDSNEIKAINLALMKAYVPVLKGTYDSWKEQNAQALQVSTEAEKHFQELFDKPISAYAAIVEALEAEAESGDKETRKRLYKALGVMEQIYGDYTAAKGSITDYPTSYEFKLSNLPTEVKAPGRPKAESNETNETETE